MTMNISTYTGDGVTVPLLDVDVTLPDAGSSITVSGAITLPGTTAVIITGSPVTAPAVPGSGSTYWIIQVNTTTGAATTKTSSSAFPSPDTGTIQIFQQQLASTASADLMLDAATAATPNSW